MSTETATRALTSAFAGQVAAASMWPALDVAGKRVGIIVAAPGGLHLVPELVDRAALVKVFHRAPMHVLPRLPGSRAIARLHILARSVAAFHRRLVVREKEMRRQLRPSRDRPVVRSNRWYGSLQSDRCQLVTWPVAAVTATGVRTADGVEHLVDLLIVD